MPSWLVSKLAGPIAAGIALLLMISTTTLGIKLWVANHDLAAVTTRATNAERDNGTLRANQATLLAGVAETKARLDSMAADATAREATRQLQDQAVDKALAKASTALAAAKPGTDKCASAADLIKEFAK